MDTDEKIYKTGKDVLIKQSRIGRDSFIDDDSIILQSEIGAKCDIEKRNLDIHFEVHYTIMSITNRY